MQLIALTSMYLTYTCNSYPIIPTNVTKLAWCHLTQMGEQIEVWCSNRGQVLWMAVIGILIVCKLLP